MVTIAHVEKLMSIKRDLQNEHSLEAEVAVVRVSDLLTRSELLLKKRTFLREERRNIRTNTEKLEELQNNIKVSYIIIFITL